MSTIPSGQPVVKEFRFFSDSRFVTVVFEDESTVEFHGEENYHKARVATATPCARPRPWGLARSSTKSRMAAAV